MIRKFIWFLTFCTALVALTPTLLMAQKTAMLVNRQPAVAGAFYSSDKHALELSLRNLFSEAKPAKLEGKIQCMIVPHAGYPYSGMVAASGY